MPAANVGFRREPERKDNSDEMRTKLDDYLLFLAAGGQSAKTIRLRRDQLTHVANGLDCLVHEIAPEQLTDWLGCQRWSRETRRSYRSAVCGFFRWANNNGLLAADPACGLPRVPQSRGIPHPLPDGIYASVLAFASPRVELMMRLAAEAGLRRAEVAAVHSGDVIATATGACLVVRGKGERERAVPVSDWLGERISYAKGWLFPSSSGGHLSAEYVGELVAAVLPAPYTMHSLRHRFATKVYRGSHNLRAVQELLGHACVATTQRYTAVEPDELAAAVRFARR